MDLVVIEWDGQHLPTQLHGLPPGRYLIQEAVEIEALTEEEEDGIQRALDQLSAGRGLSLAEALRSVRQGKPSR